MFVFQGVGQTAMDLVLLGAVPTSVIALGWGWRRHRDLLVASFGIAGLLRARYGGRGGPGGGFKGGGGGFGGGGASGKW